MLINEKFLKDTVTSAVCVKQTSFAAVMIRRENLTLKFEFYINSMTRTKRYFSMKSSITLSMYQII